MIKKFDSNLNEKWQLSFPKPTTTDDIRNSYTIGKTAQDDRGWIYFGYGFAPYDINLAEYLYDSCYNYIVALAPWTISLDLGNNNQISAGDNISLSATTSMQPTNLITGGANKMRAITDTGEIIPLSYSHTKSSGDTVWSASYKVPDNISLGSHYFTLEATADSISTDIPIDSTFAASNSSNSGIKVLSDYTVVLKTLPDTGKVCSSLDILNNPLDVLDCYSYFLSEYYREELENK